MEVVAVGKERTEDMHTLAGVGIALSSSLRLAVAAAGSTASVGAARRAAGKSSDANSSH